MEKFNVEGWAVKNKLHSVNGGWKGGAYTPRNFFQNTTLYLTSVSYNINKFLEKSGCRLHFKLKHCDHTGTYCKDSSERLHKTQCSY